MNLFDFNETIDYTTFLNNNRYNDIYIKSILSSKTQPLISCDQTASSFPLKYIENKLIKYVYPFYSNVHSNNFMGRLMSDYINESKKIIINSVGASCNKYSIIFTGYGASGAITHLSHLIKPILNENCVLFISTFEHYSNYLPWLQLNFIKSR